MLTSNKTDYGTPRDFYGWLDRQFHFSVDLAAHGGNYKHKRYFSPEQNSLHQSWEGETGFLNPPYGRGLSGWLQKARDSAMHQRAIIALVIPARVGSKWWQRYVMCADRAAGKLRESYYVPESRMLWLRWEGLVTGVYFHHERLDFEGSDERGESAPFDTAVVVHASTNRGPPAAARDPKSLLWRWP
jgi:phage N-6-adenine-methyltransferase